MAAWIHVDDTGRVTGYTGKTEIGQNIRTSLAQAIADELRVPMTTVSLVMADTDLVPFDQGTFGSLSTPRMAPVLARAAVTAREMLIDRAAALWSVDRATLTCKDARISAAGRSIGFGDLVKDRKLAGIVPAEAPVSPPASWTLRGTAARKVNGRSFVTGAHRYTPDITRPGMMYGRIIRSEGYTGTLVSLDDAAARALPGVVVVRDGDFAGVVAPTERLGAPCGGRRPRRVAHAVRRADVRDSLRTSQEGHVSGRRPRQRAISGRRRRRRRGRRAARTFDASYRIPYIAHVPLEPRAAVAEWSDGKLTVWTGTQRPFGVRAELAAAFRVPEERVRVIVPDTGSAYGGKHTRRARRRSGAAGAGRRQAGQAGVDAQGGVLLRLLPPAGVIDIKAGVDARRPADVVGVRQLELRRLGDPHAIRGPGSAHPVPPLGLAASPGLVPRAGRDRQSLRARDAHGRHRARRSASMPSSTGCGI